MQPRELIQQHLSSSEPEVDRTYSQGTRRGLQERLIESKAFLDGVASRTKQAAVIVHNKGHSKRPF